MNKALFTLPIVLTSALASAGTDIPLPKVQPTGGKPLMEVLATRQSSRSYDASKDLPLETLSALLWAGNGIARDPQHRTAPSAMNRREIVQYVVAKTATYRYDPESASLIFVKEGDFRAATGFQDFVADASVNILLACDQDRMKNMDDASRTKYSATDAAFVSANLYLYCASEGLATVVRGYFDNDAIKKAIGLPESHDVILVQSVGFPKP